MIEKHDCEKDLTMETASNTDTTDTADKDQSQPQPQNQVPPQGDAGDYAGDRQVSECDDISCETAKNECEKCDAKESEDEIKEEIKEKEEKSKRELENEVRRLSGELEKLLAALEEEKGRYIRLYAEYENYRKRTTAEKQAVYIDAYADVLKEILPVYDTLERALTMAGDTTDPAKLIEGIKLTLDMFTGALAKMGIERYGEPGEKFDPNLHNAVMHEESEAHGEGEITQVFQPGFKKGDRVLRFAMVKVAN